MRKLITTLLITLTIIVLCLALSGCEQTCKLSGCRNSPLVMFGSKVSDYCLIHADDYDPDYDF